MIKLKVENLSVSYGAINAVRGVSFEVNEGEIVALIGANGAGKTTILRTITGLERAKGGSILFEGKEIIRQKAEQLFFLYARPHQDLLIQTFLHPVKHNRPVSYLSTPHR